MENAAQYLKRAHYGILRTFLFLLDFMIADWEYGTQVASWDQLISQEEMERRLQSFNSVNNNKNVVGFQWAFYKITERLSKAMKRCGWPEANIIQWAALHVFKKEHTSKRGLAFAHDLILVSEMGDQLRRVKYLVDKDLPLADANVLFAMEGPKAKQDAAANIINPARKPWQAIYDFLQQFGTGGRIFSMMDGLASVGQAALSLGGYEVIAFEKDRTMWKEAHSVLIDHIVGLDNQQKQYAARISRSVEVIRFSFVIS